VRRLALIAAALALAACDTSPPSDWSVTDVDLKDVSGLEDCKYIAVERGGLRTPLRVIRCPSSDVSVTYAVGKTTATVVTTDPSPAKTVVVDGATYELVEQNR